MYHLYIHMLRPPVFTKISFGSCLFLTFIAFIRKEKLPFVVFFNDLLDIIVSIFFLPHFIFLSFTATVSPLPLDRSPRYLTHDLETLRGLATVLQDQQRSKNRGSWPRWAGKWSWSWPNFATNVWGKKRYISEMVAFTKIVIISAVSDGFLKF